MTGLALLENINCIDDDLIFEAENWIRPKVSNLKIIIGATVAACLCLTIGLSLGLSNKKEPPIENDISIGCPLLPGADEIYPTIMVNGKLYEWKRRRTPDDSYAIIDSLPIGSVYNGELYHIGGSMPENDREFVSVFTASGRIFVDPNGDRVYLELSTEWLDKKIVVFEPVLNRGDASEDQYELYQHINKNY